MISYILLECAKKDGYINEGHVNKDYNVSRLFSMLKKSIIIMYIGHTFVQKIITIKTLAHTFSCYYSRS